MARKIFFVQMCPKAIARAISRIHKEAELHFLSGHGGHDDLAQVKIKSQRHREDDPVVSELASARIEIKVEFAKIEIRARCD